MRRTLLILSFILLHISLSFTQTEGWTSFCANNSTPSVSEVMIDACGDEFKSEYVVMRTGNQDFDISQFSMKVINPTNNAFVGEVTIQKGTTNNAALEVLTTAAGAVCPFGVVFRDVFAAPYNGVVPANSAILFFNNKDSTDVAYLNPYTLAALCGSKVFVAFGDLRPQSRGAAIFRNYPQNGSCGAGGCLREIQFQFEGKNAPYCTKLTYDIKKLPHLNTSNPPLGFNEGSYIRPTSNGQIQYGGGNLTGNGTCMPPDSMHCVIPPQPSYGQDFWRVLVYDGLNNFNTFKGFYEAKGNHPPSITVSTGSFEYNTERDGWKPYEAPSEAHSTYGALKTYNGCNVKKDSFSIIAKRQGFPCGNYDLKLVKYDDFTRIVIDANGDGIWDYDHTFDAPACTAGCNTTIWSGVLNSNSKILIWSYDINKNFNSILVFDKKNTSPAAIKIAATVSPSISCNTPTGSIALNISGGNAPYSHTWTGATAIPNNTLIGTNLLAGVYKIVVKDGLGCQDSSNILVPQTNTIVANAGKNTALCAGGTAILRGGATGSTDSLTYEWTNQSGSFISNQITTSITPSISTYYTLKTTDTNGCFDTDTVFVKVNDAPYLTIAVSTPDSICNDEKPILKVQGAQTYTWTTFPPIAGAALSSRTGDSIALFALFLPAPVYDIKAEGTDANGCTNTIQTTITVIPLPFATIDPINDTLCSNDPPRIISFAPTTGNLDARIQANNSPCVNCIIDNKFYPANSGTGKFTVYHEVVSEKGCKSNPAIEINVKTCTTCKIDTTNLVGVTCNPLAAGILKDIKKNILGCDSVIFINFVLIKPDTFKITKTTCDSTQQGVKTVEYKNIYGCDSIVTTTTIWKKSSTIRSFSTSCNPLDTGNFKKIIPSMAGCDSLVIVSQISLSTQDFTTINTTSCDPSVIGTKTQVLKNRYNCDSLVTTITTLLKKDTTYSFSTSCNPRDTGVFPLKLTNINGCDSFHISKITLSLGDVTHSTAKTCDPLQVGKTTILPLKKLNGCDSAVHITFTLNRRDSLNSTAFICTGDSVKFGSLWYKNAGVYPIHSVNTEGCDSVVILTLNHHKKDTVFVNKTHCNRLKLGETTQHFQNQNGCDSIIITRTTFAPSPLSFNIINSKSISCANKNDGEIQLKILNGSTPPYAVRWITHDTTHFLKNIGAGLYHATVTDAEGCAVTDSFHLTDPMVMQTDAIAIPPKCFEDKLGSIRFNTITGGTAPFKLYLNNEQYMLDKLPFVVPNRAIGHYTATITDKNACSLDTNFTITTGRKLLIDLAKNAYLDLGDSITLSANADYELKSVKWTPSEGLACDTCLTTIATPFATTAYKLTIKDVEGCEATQSISVVVDKKNRIFAPNLFSPNDDGENDIFTIFTDASVQRIKTLKIFNRWGNMLFESYDFTSGDTSKGWNGTYNGTILPTDVYIFFAEIEFKDGKKEVFQGDISLMR